jgi:two-component system, LuxR family, sensor kinase FixL
VMRERMRLESEILEISSREKERVGLDLHDSLGQKLTGAVFLSRALIEHLSGHGGEDLDSARRINDILKETVAQVRRIARGLAPVELGEEGLADALRGLAEESRGLFGIACEFRSEGAPRVRNAKAAIHLYHIAQEAVTNAARHGQASRVVITLATGDGAGRLTVEDNGTGLPADADRRGGLGLRIMRYRAEMFGGALDVRAQPGGGTVLTCRFDPAGEQKASRGAGEPLS